MKFFPAVPAGGVGALSALYGPLPEARFCPTGGIDQTNAGDFLNLPNVLCVGGSWPAPAKAIEGGHWEGIEVLARRAAALAD
jgi:2-dehydro-3-deoxyphosphogluconate aldolase/(4S)-4-hydroxy-2-oxoglutarate aldolase